MIGKITKHLERLAVALPLLIGFFRLYYKNIVEKEISLGSISCEDKVLCIGGGPLPCTAMEIAQKTGATVQVIDNDPFAVEAARIILEKLNMEDRVKVDYCDGLKVDASQFSVIHVALQVQCHDRILKNIWNKAPLGARILMRSPRESLQVFYSAIVNECLTSCQYVEQENCTMKATIMLIKEKQEREASEKMGIALRRVAANRRTSLVG